MSNKDWLSIEKLVQIFEKSISLNSTVEHNVKLPDRTSSSGKKRQCDIVIRTGTEPRITTTIVEVQDRTRKFDLTYFQGLIQKMKDVGAQHLICVSTTGFTSTIKEKAKEMGGTVRLIKLTRSETENLPYEFIKFQFSDSRPIYDFETVPKIIFVRKGERPRDLNFEIQEPRFIIPEFDNKVFGIDQLIQFYCDKFNIEVEKLFTVKLPLENTSLFMQLRDELFEIQSFQWEIVIKNRVNEVEGMVYSYEQDEQGPIAWILEASSTIDSITNTIRIPVKPLADGSFAAYIFDTEFSSNK